jgi:hypothetical protein
MTCRLNREVPHRSGDSAQAGAAALGALGHGRRPRSRDVPRRRGAGIPAIGERFEGLGNFREWRRQYPVSLLFRLRRITARDDLVVVECSVSYDGGPRQDGVQLLEFREDKVARERIYAMERWEDPARARPRVFGSQYLNGSPFARENGTVYHTYTVTAPDPTTSAPPARGRRRERSGGCRERPRHSRRIPSRNGPGSRRWRGRRRGAPSLF